MTEVTDKDLIPKNPSQEIGEALAPKNSAVVVNTAYGIKGDLSVESSDYKVAADALEKFAKAGMDSKDIMEVLKGLGYEVVSQEDLLPIKKDPRKEGEFGVSSGVVIDYRWRRYDVSLGHLLDNPGTMGLVSLKSIEKLAASAQTLEVNVLVKDKLKEIQ